MPGMLHNWYCRWKDYSIDPVHLRLMEQNKSIWEKVPVINSKTTNDKSKQFRIVKNDRTGDLMDD